MKKLKELKQRQQRICLCECWVSEKKRWEMSEDDEWENAPGFGVNSQHITPHPSWGSSVLDSLSFIICISCNFPLATVFNSLLWWMLQLGLFIWSTFVFRGVFMWSYKCKFSFYLQFVQPVLNLASEHSSLQITTYSSNEHKHNLCSYVLPWFAVWLA